jgi:hypothetical protein
MHATARPGHRSSPRFSTAERAAAGRGRAGQAERAASLALLQARIRQVPGLRVVDEACGRGGALHVRIDVRGTGLSGREIAQRVRALVDAPLERCDEDGVVAVFDAGESIADGGSRLVFALAHACATTGT